MAATAEATHDKEMNGIKRVLNDTVGQVQTRFKGVEDKIKSSVEELQSRFKNVGEDRKKRIESLRDQLHFDKLDELFKRFKLKERAQEIVGEGVKLTEETIERFGLVTSGDLETVKDAMDKLVKKLETVRKRASEGVYKRDFTKLVKRVETLEAAAKK